MRRVMTWLACAAWAASPAWGQEAAQPDKAPTYWIGAMCVPSDATIRAQLQLDDLGLVVLQVLPESPAAKAGLKRYDVITHVDGNAITEVPQLMEAVSAAGGKKLKLEVHRDGKQESLTVQPEKRPEGDVLRRFGGRAPDGEQAREQAEKMRELAEKMRQKLPEGEARQMQEWVEKIRRGEQLPLRMHMFGPGVVMRSATVGTAPLPEGVTVTIKKVGSGPTSITVERGDETWTLNDKELNRLPQDLQAPVAAMVGGGPTVFNVQSGGAEAVGVATSDSGAVQVQIQTDVSTDGPQVITPPQAPTELEALKHQLESLQRQLKELQNNKSKSKAGA